MKQAFLRSNSFVRMREKGSDGKERGGGLRFQETAARKCSLPCANFKREKNGGLGQLNQKR